MMKEFLKIIMYFLVYAGIMVFVAGTVGLCYQLMGDVSDEQTTDILILSSAGANVVAVIVFVAAKWQRLSLDFFRDKVNWAVLLACVLISIGTLIPSTFLEELIPEEFMPDNAKEAFRQIMMTGYGCIAICIFAPLVEEMVFRGAIQSAAQRMFAHQSPKGEYLKNVFLLKKISGHWYAIIITSLLFALIHMNPAQMPHAFLVGLLLGWLRYRSGSIVPGVLVHCINNSAAYLLGYFYPQSIDMKIGDFFGNDDMRLAGAIAFSLVGLFIGIMEIRTLYRNKAIIDEY